MRQSPPPDSLANVADRLAQVCSTDIGLRTLRLVAQVHAHVGHGSSLPEALPPAHIDRIGIWSRQMEDGRESYVRDESEPGWLWADTQRLEPRKTGTPRIVFLGESVARGNEYAPGYAPAIVLQSILRTAGLPQAEVIDLARVSMGATQLIEVARASLALNPDAVVVFAGNNWSHALPEDLRAVASTLLQCQQPWVTARLLAERSLLDIVRRLANALGEITREKGIPVVFLIPEFNLRDWRTIEPDSPLLVPEHAEQWRTHRRAAQAACAVGDYATAESAARRMLALDGGTMSITFHLLYECSADRPSRERRALLEQARDAGLGQLREYSPRCNDFTRRALLEELPRQAVGVVDLSERLAQYQKAELPGRDLFLDYVHLNATGIRLCMAFAAQWLLSHLDTASAPAIPMLLEAAPEPPPETIAYAYVHAAYLNFMWGQDPQLQKYYCQQALEAHPSGKEMLQGLVEYQVSAAPARLCQAFCRLRERVGAAAHYSLDVFERNGRSAIGLVECALEVLEKRPAAVPYNLSTLLRRAQGPKPGATDLLDPYYRASSALVFFGGPLLGDERQRAYIRSFEPVLRFFFPCECGAGVSLTITWRIPRECRTAGVGQLYVNDCLVRELRNAHSWRTATLSLPPSLIRDGVNTVTVGWPSPNVDWRDRLEGLVRSADMGRTSTLYPVYGDLHSLSLQVK